MFFAPSFFGLGIRGFVRARAPWSVLTPTRPVSIFRSALPRVSCFHVSKWMYSIVPNLIRSLSRSTQAGSGKTLAFVLPMLRHILDQPPLAVGETGPVGLVLAPARELAYQIHIVCKGLCKHVGLRSTAVYGGAGVAEQIGDLKRGTHVLCATPGRLSESCFFSGPFPAPSRVTVMTRRNLAFGETVDLLTMQSGKMISMQRVSMVCLDEADRAFDMGFEPQVGNCPRAIMLYDPRPSGLTVHCFSFRQY